MPPAGGRRQTAAVTRSVLGHAVYRSEDRSHLDGSARYVDDIAVSTGAAWAAFVRSVDAHAAVRAIDVAAAQAEPGVLGVFVERDLALPKATAMSDNRADDRPRLAYGHVRFVGDPVAVVVAETRAQAVDAAELVVLDTEPLAAIVDPLAALPPDAPAARGDGWSDAEVVVHARFVNQRIAPAPMETNGCVVVPDGNMVVVWASTQSVFGVRQEIASALGLDPSRVVVKAPAVGGGFGAKGGTYNEQVVVAALAMRLGRAIAWSETRRENLLNMTHGRGQIQDVDVGVRGDGTIVGLRVRAVADVGADPVRGPFIPMVTRFMSSGTYRIPQIEFHPVIVQTNTTPTGPYRGAGRPEAAAMCERIVELVADELELDAIEVRRRNFVPSDAFPYKSAAGATYDSGAYEAALDAALTHSNYAHWREQQQARRRHGDRVQLGIGIGCYVEVSGRGGEYGSVAIEPDGSATVVTGSVPNGQGHETVWAQIASAVLGVPFERIRVVHSDTARVDHGTGTFGSRSLQLAGSAVHDASVAVLDQARHRVADALEASVDDVVVFDDGRVGVAGVPASALDWDAIASLPGDRLFAELDFESRGSFPFGCHVAVVEVDTETGDVRLAHLTAVDDCGTVVNPMLVEGQVHGGIAQGVAQALYEQVVYDDAGNPLTATLLDYAMPSAADLPSFSVHHTVTPTPNNPLGAKGVGESGTTGATAAVWNAVVDALKPYGVRHLDMPFTPERVWRAIRGSA
jgi:carbon-monoxide dehydrogenase large subunit